MLDVEPVILEELDRLAPSDDQAESAWDEVVRRARPARRRLTPRRAAPWALAVAIVVYLAVPAFGLGTPFLDFFSAKHAPRGVVKDFLQQNAAGSHGFGVNPKILAGQARRITVYHLRNGTPVPLDVAPRRGGGFCYDFGWAGSCTAPQARGPNERGDRKASAIGLGIASLRASTVLEGYVYDEHIAKLEVRLQHGSVSVPVLWVSRPIDAGFFFYPLTDHQRQSHTVVAVVAVDAHGKELARVGSIFHSRAARFDPRKVADLSKKHVILRSGEATIAIAPSRAGGYCFWLRSAGGAGGSGCTPPRFLTQPMLGGLGETVFSAQVKASVARVELRFQDGSRAELHPVEGFVLYSIPKSHWPRGQRLIEAIAYSSTGDRLARQRFDPKLMGIYPCSKPIPLGAGLTACP